MWNYIKVDLRHSKRYAKDVQAHVRLCYFNKLPSYSKYLVQVPIKIFIKL